MKKHSTCILFLLTLTCFQLCSPLQLTITDSFGYKHDVMTDAVFIENENKELEPNVLGRLENQELVYEMVVAFKNIKDMDYKLAAVEKTISMYQSFLKGDTFFINNGKIIRSRNYKKKKSNEVEQREDKDVIEQDFYPAFRYSLNEFYYLIKNTPFSTLYYLLQTSFILLGLKCFLQKNKNLFFGIFSKKISPATNDVDIVKELSTTHDLIATMNKYHFNTEKNQKIYDNLNILLLKEANQKEANKKVKNYGHELRGCCMCKRKLLQLKQLGESLKATSCGHVFCLKCCNKLHDKLIRTNFPCPVCAQPLMQNNGIVCLSNLYL